MRPEHRGLLQDGNAGGGAGGDGQPCAGEAGKVDQGN